MIYISKNIHSQLRLFTDDCLLYRVINTEQDTLQLQQDLDLLSNWMATEIQHKQMYYHDNAFQ